MHKYLLVLHELPLKFFSFHPWLKKIIYIFVYLHVSQGPSWFAVSIQVSSLGYLLFRINLRSRRISYRHSLIPEFTSLGMKKVLDTMCKSCRWIVQLCTTCTELISLWGSRLTAVNPQWSPHDGYHRACAVTPHCLGVCEPAWEGSTERLMEVFSTC